MRLRHILISCILACGVTFGAKADNDVVTLPTIVRDGVSYYQYQVKDGESLYGIAKLMGWDYDLLDALNPGASDKLRRGDKLIYPSDGLVSATVDSASAPVAQRSGKVNYTVTGSSNPYEVAKYLGVTTEQLYAQNPSARHGIKKGDVVTIDYSMLDAEAGEKAYPTPTPSDSSEKVAESVAERFKDSGSEETVVQKPEEAVAVSAPSSIAADSTPAEDPYSGVSNRNPLVGLDKNMLMEYTIQPGDNAQVVASNFGTTVRDIYFLNRGVSEAWFPEGLVIYLLPGSKDQDHHNVTIHSRLKTGETTYKVKKNDTFESIAGAGNITVAELRDANPGVSTLKKGKKIVVPQYVNHSEMKDVVYTDPREATSEGRSEIYREVADYGKPERNNGNMFDIVVLTSTASSDLKRDREFLRGFLLGVNSVDTRGKKVGIQVVDVTDNRLASSYMSEVKSSRPDLIVASFEKSFPDDLISYAEQNHCGLVNVFDAKNEAFTSTDEMFQVLQPSLMMNEKIAESLFDLFKNRNIIFIDDAAGESDSFATLFKDKLKNAGISFNNISSVSGLKNIEPAAGSSYVIISNAGTHGAISQTLQGVESFKKSYPDLEIALVGRPTWIVYADKMLSQFKECDTYIPSRFCYDSNSRPFVDFRDKFEAAYNVEPVVSYPPYAAMGYDVARYFISSMLRNNGDFNKKVNTPSGLEMIFDFQRESAHSGLVNKTLYWMQYTPRGVKSINF